MEGVNIQSETYHHIGGECNEDRLDLAGYDVPGCPGLGRFREGYARHL
jgi:hypothetical protein